MLMHRTLRPSTPESDGLFVGLQRRLRGCTKARSADLLPAGDVDLVSAPP